MPEITVVLDVEGYGLGLKPDPGRSWVQIAEDAPVSIGVSPETTSSGKPGVVIAIKLPNGDVAVLDTTWRLFSMAHEALLGRLGEIEMEGMRIEIPEDGRALEFVKSDEPFIECGHCSWRRAGQNTEESVADLMREYERHYRKKHRGIPPPPRFPGRN